MSDNDDHDLALSDDNMDITTNNNDEGVPVTAPVEAVTGVVTEEVEAAVLPSSEEEEEGGDEDSLPSDHLEGSDTESQKDDTEEGCALNTRTLSAEEEPPATEGLRFRSFRADRAGSDTEEEEAQSPAWPPMPTSPLRRQVGVTLSPVHGGIAGAGPDHIELVEAGPVVTGGDVPVPVWLFLAAIAVMLVYLTMVAYVMSWQCGVRH